MGAAAGCQWARLLGEVEELDFIGLGTAEAFNLHPGLLGLGGDDDDHLRVLDAEVASSDGVPGQHGVADAKHRVDQRDILRRSPPDLLLTNYRMLDLFLLRPEDRALCRERALNPTLPRARRTAHLRRRVGVGRGVPRPAAEGSARDAGVPRPWREVAERLGRADPAFAALPPDRQWLVLSSFLALVAHARRNAEGKEEPFLTVQVQLWVRELRGVVRKIEREGVELDWRDTLEVARGEHWLPIVYCRDCGHVGVGALQREGEQKLTDAWGEIGRAFLERRREAHFVTLGAVATDGTIPERLCPRCLRVAEGMQECDCTPEKTACIPVEIGRKLTEEKRFRDDCPRCGAENALTMLGSRAATLSSVAVSQLFLSRLARGGDGRPPAAGRR